MSLAGEQTTTQALTGSSSSSTNSKGIVEMALNSVGNLIKLLPTGTVFIFQFFSPLLTNSGNCDTSGKYPTAALLILCSFSCCFSTFTDSYTGSDGKVYYGLVTLKGLWSFSDPNSSSMDLSKYKLRFGDFVHGFFSLIVLAGIALPDSNTVSCFYPSFASHEKDLLMALPVVVGAISGTVFMVFPTTRHGIGYLRAQTKGDSSE